MKRILPFLLLVAASNADVIEIKPNFVQNQVTAGFNSKEQLVEENVENPANGGRVYLQIFRDTEAAAAPANFQIQILDAAGKELLRTKGGDEKPDEDADGWSSMIHINLAEPWEKQLTVKVHEKGSPKLLTFTMTRKDGEGGADSAAEIDPAKREAWEKKGRKDPQPAGEPAKKLLEAGGIVKEVIPEGLVMPGDKGQWVLKGYPDGGKLKPGDFVLCTVKLSDSKATYKGGDGAEQKLPVYEVVPAP